MLGRSSRFLGLSAVLFLASVALAAAPAAEAGWRDGGGGGGGGGKMGMRGGGGGMMRGPQKPYEFFEKRGLFSVGLEAAFPEGANCPPVASPFGSEYRYDGSQRHNNHFDYHGGMDISLDVGTPLLAIADGEVIHKGQGGLLTGNYVWLRFAPEDTGLSVYLYAKYQHLDEQSPLAVGDRVKMGDVVGPSGLTGTTGGYFGSAGYAHLHLSIFASESTEFEISGTKVSAKDNWMLDPIAVYITKPGVKLENHALRDLPDDDKRVPIPYQTVDGRRVPDGTRLVWPVRCAPN